MRPRTLLALVSLTALTLTLDACSSGSSSKKKHKSSSSGDDEFGEAYPGSLALASPTAQSGSRRLALRVTGQDFVSRKARIQAMLDGDSASDCAADFMLAAGGNGPSCYGPAIYYQNHIDGSDQTPAFLPSGDLGIWDAADASGEACIAAKMNYEIERAAAYVDTGMAAAAMLVCTANVKGAEMPGVGDTTDLLDELKDIVDEAGVENFTPTTATIKRNTPSVGEKSFTTTLDATIGNAAMSITITHEPMDSDNATYVGNIQITAKVGAGPTTSLIAVSYEQESASSLKIEFRKGDNASTVESDWWTNGSPSLPTESNRTGYSWGLFNLDPEDGTGKVAYGWVAGNQSENMRSFIVDTSGDAGTGYFGYGDSLTNVAADSTRAHWIDRMICNWAGPSNTHTGVSKVQRQTLTRGADGMFAASASAIAYSPNNTCNGNGTFAWSLTQGGSYTTFTQTNELISISSLATDALTVPSAPTAL
jgi:hypothetical protein